MQKTTAAADAGHSAMSAAAAVVRPRPRSRGLANTYCCGGCWHSCREIAKHTRMTLQQLH